jgi:hypothetical protein
MGCDVWAPSFNPWKGNSWGRTQLMYDARRMQVQTRCRRICGKLQSDKSPDCRSWDSSPVYFSGNTWTSASIFLCHKHTNPVTPPFAPFVQATARLRDDFSNVSGTIHVNVSEELAPPHCHHGSGLCSHLPGTDFEPLSSHCDQ